MKKLLVLFLVLTVAVTSVMTNGMGDKGGEKIVVGVTLMSLRHPFFQEMKEGMEETASELGVMLRITDADFDSAIQSNQIQDFVHQKVSGIIITPTDSLALGPSVQKAVEAGVPVITVDVAAQGADVVTHIASDNVKGGEIAGGLMREALKKRNLSSGTIVIVSHVGVTSVEQRTEGFTKVMSRDMSNVKLEIMDAVGQRDKAMSVTEDAIQRFGKSLIGVFGINDDTSLGALSAVERANLLKQISIVGYDAGDESRAAIEAGKIVGNTIQLPALMGRMGIENITKYIKGTKKDFPDFMPVSVGTYTKDGAQMAE